MANPPENRGSETRENEDRPHRVGNAAQQTKEAVRTVRNIGVRSNDVIEDAAKRTVEVTREAARQGQEALAKGIDVAAEVASPLAEASYDAGSRVVGNSAHITALYREATSDTAEDLQALTTTYYQLGQGLVRLQRAYLDTVQQSFGRAKRQPHELLRCNSMAEFVEVQLDLYKDGVAFVLETNTALLKLAGEVVLNAVQPLEARAGDRAVKL